MKFGTALFLCSFSDLIQSNTLLAINGGSVFVWWI